MSMSKEDLAVIREEGRELIKGIMIEHIASCPHHQKYLITKARIVGLFFGMIVASGATSGTIFAVLIKVLGV